jgi:5-methyltetrahydrofolate--homocysteine methyltransferase
MALEVLADCIITGDGPGAQIALRDALAAGAEPLMLLQDTMIPAMGVVGEKFGKGEYFIPEMLLAARAMKGCMAILEPLLVGAETGSAGGVVVGSVKGDLHDIGKNIVVMMLKGAGFTVHDLGVDVSPERFVAAVQEYHPQIVGLSCLITTTMPMMAEVIHALESAGIRDQVKVMVGGAPVSQEYAERIGADAFAPNAGVAPVMARNLLS